MQSLLQPASHSAGSLSAEDLPGSLRARLGGALPWQYEKLAGDANLEVHVAKVLLPEEMCMLITVLNKAGAATNGTVIQVDPPRNFQTQCMSEPPSDIQNNRIGFSTVPEHSQVHAVVQMAMSELSPSMAMRGQISYMLGGANKSLSFQTQLSVTDLIRPCQMSTPQFGQTWESLGDGRQLVVRPTSVNSTMEFMRRVGNIIHMHPVETIDQECICAGRLAGTDTLCFIHAEVDTPNRQLSITCNSLNNALTEMLSRSCAIDFK